MIDLNRSNRIQGWMAEGELSWLAQQSEKCNIVLELGAWKGRSTVVMAQYVKDFCISIDTFGGTPGDGGHEEALEQGGDKIYNDFMRNTWDLQCSGKLWPFRCRGESAASLVSEFFGKFDLAFVDAAHDAESVKRDIGLFRPLIRSGGILAGHDWMWPGLSEAVLSVAPEAVVVPHTSIWWCQIK